MKNVKLPDDLRLSVPRLDREHAEVLRTATELRTLLDSSSGSLSALRQMLAGFADLVWGHFTSEEEMMQSRGYPGWRHHAAEHRRLFEQLTSIQTGVSTGAIGPCGALAVFIDVWTRQHIQRSDRRFAEFLRSEVVAGDKLKALQP